MTSERCPVIRLIIFDIGGVIIKFREEQYIGYIARKWHINQRKLKKELLPLIAAMEYGKMNADDAKWMIADGINLPQDKLEWSKAFRKIAKLDKEVFELVKRLSKGHRLVLLSDVSESRYKEVQAMGLRRLRVRRFLSYKMGLRKQDLNPRRRPFRYMLRVMRVRPEAALFVDDRPLNIAHAEEAGINCIRFRNYAQLVKDLKRYGIE